MNASTENSTEKSLQKVSAEKPTSVYSVKFTKVINNFAEESVITKQKSSKIAAQNSFSKKVFRWRNAAAMAAILAIGVFHFAFQMSFIRSEVSENRPVIEVPPVNLEPVRTAPVETESADVEIRKINAELPPKRTRAVRQKQSAAFAAPSKPQLKKREAVETRAVRLRRAERILTGV